MRFCPPNCKYLSPTEAEQHAGERPFARHWCTLYDKQVFHGMAHPEIIRLDECRVEEL